MIQRFHISRLISSQNLKQTLSWASSSKVRFEKHLEESNPVPKEQVKAEETQENDEPKAEA